MRAALLTADEDWDVWTGWYERRLAGAPLGLPLERAWLQLSDDDWNQGPAHANRKLKEVIESQNGTEEGEQEDAPAAAPEVSPQRPAVTPEQIAAAASPQPFLTPDGRLDAGPNAEFDVPEASADLATLPIRQQRLIENILSALPPQAPKILAPTLADYRDELKVRGVRPILGMLNDMAAVIRAAVEARRADDEWLDEGSREAFNRFAANHALFVEHFPLDARREEIYAATKVDEEAATGAALSEPAEAVAKATAEVHKAGLPTDDFIKIVGSLTELIKAHAYAPPAPPPAAVIAPERPPDALRADPADGPPHVSAKKRGLLNFFGFLLKVYNFAGSTASIAGPDKVTAFMDAIRKAIDALRAFIDF